MQQSPLKNKQYNDLEEQKRQILIQLEYLFTYYASKSNRHNYRQLNHKFFIEMLNKLLGREPQKKRRHLQPQKQKKFEEYEKKFSIIYYSKGIKQGVNFQHFLNFIPSLAVIFYENMDKQQGTKMFINDLRVMYQNEVFEKLSGKVINVNFNLSRDIKSYILRLLNEFTKIYKAYFPHEFNNNLKSHRYEDESLKCYFQFLKDFEIMPKLITAGQAYYIFREASKNRDWDPDIIIDKQQTKSEKRTQYFSLNKFIGALVIVSQNTYKKLKQYGQQEDIEDNTKQAFKTLLQHIEMTKAYKKQRHLKQTNESFSFILLEEYPKQSNMRVLKMNNSIIKSPKGKLQFMNILKNMDI